MRAKAEQAPSLIVDYNDLADVVRTARNSSGIIRLPIRVAHLERAISEKRAERINKCRDAWRTAQKVKPTIIDDYVQREFELLSDLAWKVIDAFDLVEMYANDAIYDDELLNEEHLHKSLLALGFRQLQSGYRDEIEESIRGSQSRVHAMLREHMQYRGIQKPPRRASDSSQ
jgi:hypothetical protein